MDPPSVLVADDVQVIRTVFCDDVLYRAFPAGSDVHHALDAYTFFQGMRRRRDIIVVDLRLGRDDGHDLLVRAHRLQPNAVLVLMSAYEEFPSDALELGRAGIDAVVQKPWEAFPFARLLWELHMLTPAERRARREERGALLLAAATPS